MSKTLIQNTIEDSKIVLCILCICIDVINNNESTCKLHVNDNFIYKLVFVNFLIENN